MAERGGARRVLRTLELLRPWDTAMPKRRLGPQGQGGHVLLDDFDRVEAALCFGGGPALGFEQAVMALGIPVWAWDPVLTAPPLLHPDLAFTRAALIAVGSGELLVTLEEAAAETRTGGDLLLKLELGGTEWEVLAQAPDAVLRRCRQIVVRLHWLHRLGELGFRLLVQAALENLARRFTPVHVCADERVPVLHVQGVQVPPLLEVTFARTDGITRRPGRTAYPGLDMPPFAPEG